MNYTDFIASKKVADQSSGLYVVPELNPMLFDFQRAIVGWSLRRGRAAIFADCGLGKTPMQLEWANNVPGRVIIVAPLAVGPQTEREGIKFGVNARYMREDDPSQRIVITNYEMLERFNPWDFSGIVLDESSILKSYTGKFRTYLTDEWTRVRFRLCCTATPAPNDHMELGNHAEFLGVMRGSEMLSSFFINDPGHVGHYRLKNHAMNPFFEWMASWSVMLRNPSDVGFDGSAFVLPRMHLHHKVTSDTSKPDGMLFALDAATLSERLDARRRTTECRCREAADLVNSSKEEWVVWCNLNSESELLASLIPDAVEVTGSDSIDEKEARMAAFTTGKARVIVSKPSIAGFGVNWQHCRNMVFVGLSDSYEQLYQALRRCWRFGQKRQVHAHIVTANTEGAVLSNIKRKEEQAQELFSGMVKHMSRISTGVLHGDVAFAKSYFPTEPIQLPNL